MPLLPKGCPITTHPKPQALRPRIRPGSHPHISRPGHQCSRHPAVLHQHPRAPYQDPDHGPIDRRVRQAHGGDHQGCEGAYHHYHHLRHRHRRTQLRQADRRLLRRLASTYSGDRYSLPELISKVIMKGHRLKGPLVTVALVSALDFGSMFLEILLLQLVIRRSGVVAMAVVTVISSVAFVYLNVVFLVAVAVSVADAEHRGVSALRQAWQLMTRKEGCALVLVVELLTMAPSPLYVAALGYAKKSVAAGLAVLSAYELLSGVVQLFYFAAAMVYYCKAVDSKETVACEDHVKIPTGEANA